VECSLPKEEIGRKMIPRKALAFLQRRTTMMKHFEKDRCMSLGVVMGVGVLLFNPLDNLRGNLLRCVTLLISRLPQQPSIPPHFVASSSSSRLRLKIEK
jgi:hypothetical protein